MNKTKRRFLSILLTLALILGLMPGMSLTAYADNKTYDIVFAANGKTKTVRNVRLPYSFYCDNGESRLDQIIIDFYGLTEGGYCDNENAPIASGGGGKVTAGLSDDGNQFITIRPFSGTATVTGYYYDYSEWDDANECFARVGYSLEITCVDRDSSVEVTEWHVGDSINLAGKYIRPDEIWNYDDICKCNDPRSINLSG